MSAARLARAVTAAAVSAARGRAPAACLAASATSPRLAWAAAGARSASSSTAARSDSETAEPEHDAGPSLPPNVVLDPTALSLVSASEAEAAAGTEGGDVAASADSRVDRYLERLGDVAARPLVEPELSVPVFDIMATAFAPLERPHPLAVDGPDGAESADAPEVPDAAPAASSLTLSAGVWAEPLRTDILHRVVAWQRAKRRTTAYRGRTYAEKSGSGRKPFRQKGTGMARQGNKRAPIQRGGVKAHAPVLRDWSKRLNKRVRRMGVRVALSAKLAEGSVVVVDGLGAFASAKTADLSRRLGAVARASGVGRCTEDGLAASTTLLVVSEAEMTEPLTTAAGNLRRVELVSQLGCTVYDLLRRDVVAVSPAAVEELSLRLEQ